MNEQTWKSKYHEVRNGEGKHETKKNKKQRRLKVRSTVSINTRGGTRQAHVLVV